MIHQRRHPPPPQRPSPPFAVFLDYSGDPSGPRVTLPDLRGLVSKCPVKPRSAAVRPDGPAGRLLYDSRADAVDCLAHFWRLCLGGGLNLPAPVISPCARSVGEWEVETARLREVFGAHVSGLLCGDSVRKVERRIDEVAAEIARVGGLLKMRNNMKLFMEFEAQMKGLKAEREQLVERLEEFRAGMRSVLARVDGKVGDGSVGEVGGFELFELGGELDWFWLWRIIVRECRRLDDGLPIYACRRKILAEVLRNQVTVLIGETGCGKSTQLVQFIADTGIAINGSILCTQPRKIAAITLAQRVKEESYGCYMDNSIVSHPSFSSSQKFDSKIMFMTDHCLLQYCMNNTSLAGISCIIVDEAHERSLNTDLLLALIKKLLLQRFDLRIIIMSATADANKFADYYFGCQTIHVIGRSFPVEIKYVPDVSAEACLAKVSCQVSGYVSTYVADVVNMVSIIHKSEESGAILAFLTSQMEVEWACENFQCPSAVVLPLHGKLAGEEQCRVFQNYVGKRKVIFSTNLAETSLTIPGIKFVVDCGMVKESKFVPGTGMNVLSVCKASQSSAKQRAGRAGRTQPGKCYRLYSECDFQLMPPYQDPEIQKVHLGIAVLRILSLGVKNVKEFEFVDPPSSKAIDTAIGNLIRLGAITCKDEILELTSTGRRLVKLNIEPRLGKIILECHNYSLSKEGLVLAAVMANASSIFCRVGSNEEKLKADCLKIPFCHSDGDLFTLLSVFKEWESQGQNKNKWCWQNSINAKSLRRCQETVNDLEHCLRHELNIIVPSYWKWKPSEISYNKLLKKAMLASLAENVAMYSGCERLGYLVAQTGEHIQLHPSSSLHIYSEKPRWVVFGEILSISSQYLVCVTSLDGDLLHTIQPSPPYDIMKLESQEMQVTTIYGLGCHLLRRLCGRGNRDLQCLVARVKSNCKDVHADISVDFDRGLVQLFTSSQDMEMASSLVNDSIDFERRYLSNECIEKHLYNRGPNFSPSSALFGAGAAIKHLELEKRFLTVEVSHPNVDTLDDKGLLKLVDRSVSGLCSFCKHVGTERDGSDSSKRGKITFLTPEASADAVNKLNGLEFSGATVGVCPIWSSKGDHGLPFHAIRAKVCWPRRRSKGVAFIRCMVQDAEFIVQDLVGLTIEGQYVRCEISTRRSDCVVLAGFSKNLTEPEIYDVVRRATKRIIFDVFLLRGDVVDFPSRSVCEEQLCREIMPFMSSSCYPSVNFRVEVFNHGPKDSMMKAAIVFDESLYQEAAKALEHLRGRVLPSCLPWQKIECQQLFQSSLSCPRHVYSVIKEELDIVLKSFKYVKGVSWESDSYTNGTYRVKLSANATKTIANLRKPLEPLMNGRIICHNGLTPTVLQHLLSRNGFAFMKALERETGTCIIYDRHNFKLRVFGSRTNVNMAEKRLVESLLSFHENKPLEIHLRGSELPPNLLKEVVRRFGPELHGLKEKVPGADFVLNIRHHKLSVFGNQETKQKVEEIISEVIQSLGSSETVEHKSEVTCGICLCELEEPYMLEACRHVFCRTCLLEQYESAIKSHDGFPLCCAKEGCRIPILLVDLRSLLCNGKLEELFRASLSAFVASSAGAYRFCPSPDCPMVYKVAGPDGSDTPFKCEACFAETCTKCHLESHPSISCELYKQFKDQPDASLMEWRKGKEHVKNCPLCGYTIEKVDGCNHIECRCGRHICWVCLESFESSDGCYNHLRNIHQSIV